MKVHEIISQEQLNEAGVSTAAKLMSKIPGVTKGAELVASAFGKGLVSKSRTILATAIQRQGSTPSAQQIEALLLRRIPGMTQAKAAKLAADPRFIKSAEKLGAKTASAQSLAANAATISAAASSGMSIIKGLVNVGIPLYAMSQLLEIWQLVYDNSISMQQEVAAQNMTMEQYTAYKKIDVEKATAKTIAWVASIGLAKLPLGVVTKILKYFYKFKPGSKVGTMLSNIKTGINTAGTLALMNWINTPEGEKAIANIFSGILSGPLGYISQYMLSAEEKLESLLSGTAIPSKPETSQQSQSQSSDDQVAQQVAEPKQAPDYSKWEYSSPGHIKNPITGEIHRSSTAY